MSQKEIKHLLEERAKVIELREQINKIKTRIAKVDKEPLIIDDEIVDLDFFSELLLSPIDPKGTIIPAEWKKLEVSADSFVKALEKDKEKIINQIKELIDKIVELEPSIDFDKRLTDIWEQIQEESIKKGITIIINDLEKLDSIQKEITALKEQLKVVNEKKKEKTTFLDERKYLLTEYTEHLNHIQNYLENNFSDLLKNDGAILNDTIKLELEINLPLESYLEIIEGKAQHNTEDEIPRFPAKKYLLELFNTLGAEKIVRDLRNNYFNDWSTRGFGTGSLVYFKKMQNKEEVAMYLEEFLPSLTSHLLWRPDSIRDFKLLKECSIGERGTALLSVILISGREPLIIDQPEDDLDHFYLYKTLTPIIKEVKKRRQLIFATHDANIVINGDAELILITITDDGKFGDVILTSIENLNNRDLVMEVLEGGREAFRKRKDKYGKTAE